MMAMSVGVVLFGDHPDLAARCLGPLWPLQRDGLIDLRIGCNQCGPTTMKYLQDSGAFTAPNVGLISVLENFHKYPLMRHLLGMAPLAPSFMWLDDDSFISHPDPAAFVRTCADLCRTYHMVGQVWRVPLDGNQHLWVASRPWYRHKPVLRRHMVSFCQGAWWTIRSEVLLQNDWPDPDIERKGGDVMLGELCRQQDLRIYDIRKSAADFGVRVNADEHGRHSKMPTRGPKPLPKPVGWYYQPAKL